MSNTVVSLDSYSLFIKQLENCPVLNSKEEMELAYLLRDNGDKEAAHKLILSQLKNVCYISNQYYKFGLQKIDLIQEGTIGLMKAVKKFDPDKGFRLSTYASFWIKESIHNFVINSWSLVKFGTTKLQRSIFAGLKNSKESIAFMDGHNIQNVADSYGISVDRYKSIAGRIINRDSSVELLTENGIEFEDKSLNPEDILMEKTNNFNNKYKIKNAMKLLNERDSYIFKSRKLTEEPKSLKDLSLELNISIERVRQLEKRAFDKVSLEILNNYICY